MVKVTLALKNLGYRSLSLEGTAKSDSHGDCIDLTSPTPNSAPVCDWFILLTQSIMGQSRRHKWHHALRPNALFWFFKAKSLFYLTAHGIHV